MSPSVLSYQNPELENPSLTHINRLPPRSNLIPAQVSGIYYKNKEESQLLQSLCGNYKFYYAQCDCIDNFYTLTFDDSYFDTIDVPSMWQYRGYGKCQYPNTTYPIPFDPPFVRCENPVGYYRRTFIAHPREKAILHFGGVDNAFYVYLNGMFVGFSKGSRIPAEFDVSSFIRDGENLLAVKVFTYSDATYLENQDMLLANGIFRDVYLLHTENVSLWDFWVRTDLKGFWIETEINEIAPEYDLEIRVDKVTQSFPVARSIKTYFPIENPKLWNSEEPNLYSMEIRILKNGIVTEVHSKKIGMLHSCVCGNHLLVNGSPIYVKGVNRHEYDCDNGRAVSVELINKELRMIKANNINAIRCSHYTNHPAFYEICSELGLFVMDEVDLETHGCEVTGDQGYLSKDPKWLAAYVDRTERMLKQNKNEVCIFMYSMGNECGQGENLLKCQEIARKYEPDIISIHDQLQSQDELVHQPNKEYDIIKRAGYLSFGDLEEVIQAQPVCMQVEYAHAMGNSPGSLADYQRYVYENDNYLGGFVWEFKNHGFHKVDKNGKDYYLYGGDFGDINHWANFCLDGYIMSDGTPKPSWYELGEVFAPVYVTMVSQRICVKNTFNFRNLSSLHMKWEIKEDYTVVKCGVCELPNVPPHEEIFLDLDITPKNQIAGAAYYLNLYFYDEEHCVATRQFELSNAQSKKAYEPGMFTGNMECTGGDVKISGEDYVIVIRNGMLCNYARNGITLIDSPFAFNFYRAPIDNDGILGIDNTWFHRDAAQWNQSLIYTMHFTPSEITCEKLHKSVVCCCKGKVVPTARYYGFDAEITYQIFQDGLITVSIVAIPYGMFPRTLPRIGLCVTLDSQYQNVTWYGRGPRENYCDCLMAAPIGLYTKPITETYTVFDMPQDTGNHENTSFVIVSNMEGNGIAVIGCDNFAYSFHDFSLEELTKAQHKNELKKDNHNRLYIDYKMRGLGSHSCGPMLEEKYDVLPCAFQFSFALTGNVTSETALSLSRSDLGVTTKQLECNIKLSEQITQDELTLL